MFKKYLFLFIAVSCFLLSGNFVYARDINNITDWYIQSFETSIVVNEDSSLLITENITADCGNLAGKHGIFRILPTKVKTNKEVFKNPVELISITDFNGNSYKYTIISENDTITWKIGDPQKTVSGVNNYKIIYKVKNAIRFGNQNFDELYWNLLGNYWDIDIDNFSAQIVFPSEINSLNSRVDFYTGFLGSQGKDAIYSFNNNILSFSSTKSYPPKYGITVSVTFPKNIFTPYVPTFWDKYGNYLWLFSFIFPVVIFIFCFKKWKKFGKDPKMKTPIPPEFGIPENITPIQMGVILSHGGWRSNFITATIIDLAVKKNIFIEQTEEKKFLSSSKEITLKINNNNIAGLNAPERKILDKIFDNGNESVKISSLRKNFYKQLPDIMNTAREDAIKNGWIEKKGGKYSIIFIILGSVIIWFSIWSIALSIFLFFSLLFSGAILIIFGIIMPKRTEKGVDLLFKIKGFEIYMRQAENYRQQFYEKENIFDKFLPYAIIFGIAELWVKKMEIIYGEDYFKNYHPFWMSGIGSSTFNAKTFNNQLNSISTSISQNIGGASGSGGSGGSGGGGGGGGGGGW